MVAASDIVLVMNERTVLVLMVVSLKGCQLPNRCIARSVPARPGSCACLEAALLESDVRPGARVAPGRLSLPSDGADRWKFLQGF